MEGAFAIRRKAIARRSLKSNMHCMYIYICIQILCGVMTNRQVDITQRPADKEKTLLVDWLHTVVSSACGG